MKNRWKNVAALMTAAVMTTSSFGNISISVMAEESNILAETQEETVSSDISDIIEIESESEDIQAAGLSTDEAETTVEIIEETQEESETESVESEEVDEEIPEQSENMANSWRYTNGEWDVTDDSSNLYEAVENAWSKVNGHMINSVGEVIPGAYKKGIDVSAWQGKIDWEAVKNDGVDYAIIRCGWGDNYTSQDDSYWKRNADECTRLGIPFGTYIYSYAETTAQAVSEAQHTLRLISGYDLSYPIYLDLEDKVTANLSKNEILAIAKAYCETIEKAGYSVGIYANLYWWNNLLTSTEYNQWTRWVAQYNTTCDYSGNYLMWQCTSSGQVKGISGSVDVNMWYMPYHWSDYLSGNVEDPVEESQARAFVERCYKEILGRTNAVSDAEISYWADQIADRTLDGATILSNFVYSQEYQNSNSSHSEFVKMLYRVCLSREADENGLASWVSDLESGVSLDYVMQGFVDSVEFQEFCAEYQIESGKIELTQYRDQNLGVTHFIYQCYEEYLDRTPDGNGINMWSGELINHKKTPKEVAYGFVFSSEFQKKQYSNTEYVKKMYWGLLDRGADQDGLNQWVQQMNNGMSREELFNGFADSDEFKEK